MQAVELQILNWIQENLRCEALDGILRAVSWTANHGEIWILLALLLLLIRRTRKLGAAVGSGLAVDLLLCNLWLKPMINRVRPFVVNPEIQLICTPPTDASFPSGHTAASFAAVFALWRMGSPLWKPALVYACIMAFSRLYLYVHWPSDVLGGMLVGAVAGILGAELVLRLQKRKQKTGEEP